MSCHEEGSNTADGVDFPLELEPPLVPFVGESSVSLPQATGPEQFTRKELQALRDKASDLLPWTNMAEFDLLEDLVQTLDLLDALQARKDADLAELEETIAEHTVPAGVTIDPPPLTPYPCPGLPLVISVDGKPINLGDC